MASAAASRRSTVNGLMRAVNHGVTCPCHGCRTANGITDVVQAGKALLSKGRARTYTVPATETTTDYAFEVSAANLRFGSGVTREIGMDFNNMKATKVGVFTDPTVAKLLPMKQAIESLESNGVKYEIFDRCRVEPNQDSWEDAINFARSKNFSHFLAVGGGSSMDTAKVANLFSCYPDTDLLEFVNAPVGKGTPIAKTLKPLVAVPTTAGTGSETTGTAIFDYTPLSAKTGIASRAMRPTLGIVDPLNTESCPRPVHISAGLDTLFHALESYTAIPYTSRSPRPDNPLKRPAYQGRNPVADVFSLWALQQTVKYLPRVAKDQHDKEALEAMLLASTFAGIGFGTAGVHLCHGLSYGISGLNKTLPKWAGSGYQVDHPLVPHGVSVAITAPAVFQFTTPSSPDRHREVSAIFNRYKPDNVDDSKISDEDIGKVLYDRIARFLVDLDMPRGIGALGYTKKDIPKLVESTLPQARVLVLAPGYENNEEGRHQLSGILENSMSF
ncbi:Dehydroquinate synthase-like protein [Cystobasidium minutum MCA 4210]|uniref:Dehydroquinate synthase-like protein n=1 Tax=Cystobasidium minutum MCA 4210 TaxID=1397322 RepID=UPI0034CE8939|eukprot:jgi/Rhomi1/18523/CE18522_2353